MKARAILLASVAVLWAAPVLAAAPTGREADDPENLAPPQAGVAAAGAQDDGDIIVTARRREERLSDIPGGASVIDQQTLLDRGGAATVSSLLAGQAGVRFLDTSSPINSEISIRASPTARATNADPSIGLYRNNVYIGGGTAGGRSFTRLDLFDPGRVEVLRGTQGALYGRNAVGGAINIVSAQPEFDFSGWADARFIFDVDAVQLQAVQNAKLDDRTAIRLGVDYAHQRKGFFYNPDNDRYFDRIDSTGLRAQLRRKQGDFEFNLLVEGQRATVPAITYQVYINPSPSFPRGYYQPKYSYDWNFAPNARQDVDNIVFSTRGDLGWATLESNLGYRRRKTVYDYDADAIDIPDYQAGRADGSIAVPLDPSASVENGDTTRIYNAEIHLSGTTLAGKLDWLAGTEYFAEESVSYILTGRTPTTANPSVGSRAPSRQTFDSLAVFGTLGYALTDRLKIEGELRYSDDRRAVTSRRYDLSTGALAGGASFNVDAHLASSKPVYNATLSWKFADDFLAYAKAGSSYRSGGFNTNLGDPRQPVPVPPSYANESSKSYEIGVKGKVAPRIYLTTAAYLTNTSDLIVQTDNGCAATNRSCPTLATSFLTNAGKARTWGVEVELLGAAKVAGGDLRFSLRGSRQQGKVTSGQYDGAELPQVPHWIAGADLTYRHAVSNTAKLFVNANYNGQWGGQQELVPPRFDLTTQQNLNLRAGLEYGKITISGFANNITNESYVLYYSTTTRRYNQPRTYGVQLHVGW